MHIDALQQLSLEKMRKLSSSFLLTVSLSHQLVVLVGSSLSSSSQPIQVSAEKTEFFPKTYRSSLGSDIYTLFSEESFSGLGLSDSSPQSIKEDVEERIKEGFELSFDVAIKIASTVLVLITCFWLISLVTSKGKDIGNNFDKRLSDTIHLSGKIILRSVSIVLIFTLWGLTLPKGITKILHKVGEYAKILSAEQRSTLVGSVLFRHIFFNIKGSKIRLPSFIVSVLGSLYVGYHLNFNGAISFGDHVLIERKSNEGWDPKEVYSGLFDFTQDDEDGSQPLEAPSKNGKSQNSPSVSFSPQTSTKSYLPVKLTSSEKEGIIESDRSVQFDQLQLLFENKKPLKVLNKGYTYIISPSKTQRGRVEIKKDDGLVIAYIVYYNGFFRVAQGGSNTAAITENILNGLQ